MTLLQFLRQARQVHLQFLSGTLPEPPIYVLGNPSADLDSIISAIVYSYCASNRLPSTTPRPHIPLLNLPIPAGPELYRLRPEFVTTLWLSTNFPPLKPDERFENSSESGKLLHEHIVTIADFAQSLQEHATRPSKLIADATLVDWNAMPHRADPQGHGSVTGLSEVTFRTVGCIDHHVDEHFVPANALPANQPLIIQPGPGSCSSLITNELVRRGLWADSAESAQLAKLALAAILIDTSNLMAEGKVTDVDIRAVEFLRKQVARQDPKWDAEAFYNEINSAKKNSLDLLTLDEVLERDYKEWSEVSSSGESVKLGFCSSVKPIRWIVEKAGAPRQFLDAVRAFAASKKLDVVVVMTSFTSEGKFSRELFVCAMCHCDAAVKAAEAFVEQAGSDLGFERWSVDCRDPDTTERENEIRSTLDGDSDVWRRLWMQTNTTASRKQVAPLLRKAVANL